VTSMVEVFRTGRRPAGGNGRCGLLARIGSVLESAAALVAGS